MKQNVEHCAILSALKGTCSVPYAALAEGWDRAAVSSGVPHMVTEYRFGDIGCSYLQRAAQTLVVFMSGVYPTCGQLTVRVWARRVLFARFGRGFHVETRPIPRR